MNFKGNKAALPSKPFEQCGRPMSWRKAWARNWSQIKYCQRALPQGAEMRNLVLVLGDQLDLDSSAFDGFDPAQDAVWMAEVLEESRHVWSSQPRTALFLAAMRANRDIRDSEHKGIIISTRNSR